jgi:hypothetical protein
MDVKSIDGEGEVYLGSRVKSPELKSESIVPRARTLPADILPGAGPQLTEADIGQPDVSQLMRYDFALADRD